MKKIYVLFLLLLIIPLVSASVSTVAKGSEYEIKRAVRINGGIPSNDTMCNITVLFANDTVLVDFKAMTYSEKYFNYTLNGNQTAIKGDYKYDITCIQGNYNATERFNFIINKGGIAPSDSRTNATTRTIYLTFALGILFFIGFLWIKKGYTYKFTFLLMALLMFIVAINLIFVSLQDEVINPSIEIFFDKFTAYSFYMYLGIFILLAFLWILSMVSTLFASMENRKAKKLGVFDEQ